MTLKENMDFAQALTSNQPSEALGEYADYSNWLIGGWDFKAIDYLSPDKKIESLGEWYFAWVLEGRAVQDVWVAPKRALRTKDTTTVRNRYGSTIRTFDFNTKTWTITWFNPVTGAKDTQATKKEGLDIVQMGTGSDGNIIMKVA